MEMSQSENTGYVIFDKTYSSNERFIFEDAHGYFTPSNADVSLAESLIRIRMAKLDVYYRQYYGVINKNGHRILHMRAIDKNLVAQGQFQTWRTELVTVFDGGDAFLDAAVDLDDKALLYAKYHGES